MDKCKPQIVRIFLIIVPIALLSFCKPDNKKGQDFEKGPYLQNQKNTEITIMWETKTLEKGEVQYGTKEKLTNAKPEEEAVKLHKVILSGLEPATSYSYRVVSGNKTGKVFTFQTAVNKSDPFTLAVYGDNKNGPFNHEKIAGLILNKKPNLVISNGDLVERGRVYEQWEKLFFTPIRELAARIPIYPIMGNHEDNSTYYYNFFDPPVDDTPWYSFDYGNAHIIILNSEEEFLLDSDEQIKWLKDDLEKHKDAVWKIVTLHVPPFTCGGNYYARGRLEVKEILAPVFLKYGVDMVLSGHDHHYERTYPIASKESETPTTFVVCGNGGTPLRYIYPREFTKYAERVFGFTLLKIDDTELHFQAININNEIMDEFTLDKNDPESMANYRSDMLYYEDIKDATKEVAKYFRNGRKAEKNNNAQAITDFQKALELDPTCYPAMGQMAVRYSYLDQHEKAIETAFAAQKEMPGFPDSYEALIRTYKILGNYEEALKWGQKLYEVTSDSPDAYIEMGEIYLEMKDTVKAMESFHKAYSILPNDFEIHFILAELYAETGNIDEAVNFYKEGVSWYLDEEKEEDYYKAKEFIQHHQSNL